MSDRHDGREIAVTPRVGVRGCLRPPCAVKFSLSSSSYIEVSKSAFPGAWSLEMPSLLFSGCASVGLPAGVSSSATVTTGGEHGHASC